MTLDEAIKCAEEVASECKSKTDWGMGNAFIDRSRVAVITKCGEEHRQLAEWLKELKQLREQTRWIPVSERLPERNKNVIVTDFETSDTYQSQYIGNRYWECDNGLFKNRIIAWMPLPEPYKAERED